MAMTRFSIFATLAIWKINPGRWLSVCFDTYAQASSTASDDVAAMPHELMRAARFIKPRLKHKRRQSFSRSPAACGLRLAACALRLIFDRPMLNFEPRQIGNQFLQMF